MNAEGTCRCTGALAKRRVARDTQRTLANVETEALLEAVANRLGKVGAETLSDTLGEVKTEAVVPSSQLFSGGRGTSVQRLKITR